MDAQLSVNAYLAGDDYSIADIICFPWAVLLPERIDEAAWTKFPNLKRWVDEVGARPAVQTGRKVHKEWGARKLTPDEQKARQALLFNQTNDKVRAAREQAAKGLQ